MSRDLPQASRIAGTGALEPSNPSSAQSPAMPLEAEDWDLGSKKPPGPSVFIDQSVAGKVWCHLPQFPDDMEGDGETSLH